MTCQHDPLYTHDGRCSKCYPRKRMIMVQHADGTQEIDDRLTPSRWDDCALCGHIRACHDPLCYVNDCTGHEFVEQPRPGYITKVLDRAAVELAEAKAAEFADWQQDNERGDGMAGNSVDAYDSSAEGHW